MDMEKQCTLIIIGADKWGNKDIFDLVDGYRESTQSWHGNPPEEVLSQSFPKSEYDEAGQV